MSYGKWFDRSTHPYRYLSEVHNQTALYTKQISGLPGNTKSKRTPYPKHQQKKKKKNTFPPVQLHVSCWPTHCDKADNQETMINNGEPQYRYKGSTGKVHS